MLHFFCARYTGINARTIVAAIKKRINPKQHTAKIGPLASKPERRAVMGTAAGGGAYILASDEY